MAVMALSSPTSEDCTTYVRKTAVISCEPFYCVTQCTEDICLVRRSSSHSIRAYLGKCSDKMCANVCSHGCELFRIGAEHLLHD